MAPQPGAEEDLQLGSGGGVAENKFQHNTCRGGPGTEGAAAQEPIEKLKEVHESRLAHLILYYLISCYPKLQILAKRFYIMIKFSANTVFLEYHNDGLPREDPLTSLFFTVILLVYPSLGHPEVFLGHPGSSWGHSVVILS